MSNLFICLVAVSWLIPAHNFPWPSATAEAFAILCLTIAILTSKKPTCRVSLWVFPIGIAVILAVFQYAADKIVSRGDLLLVIIYLTIFQLAIILGQSLIDDANNTNSSDIKKIFFSVALCGIASSGIAACQWTGTCPSSIWIMPNAPGQRPFGNISQPNSLSTVLVLAICSIAYLRSRETISKSIYLLAITILVFGLSLSGSRTGVVQVILIALMYELYKYMKQDNTDALLFRSIAPLYFISFTLTRFLSEFLEIGQIRSFGESIEGGTRLKHYLTMFEAMTQSPWLGYGWLQVSRAQQVASLDQDASLEQISYSHNLLLDIIIWCGIPAGLLIIITSLFLLSKKTGQLRDRYNLWILFSIIAISVHGLTEYPHAYAYFIIPFGLLIGLSHHEGLFFKMLTLNHKHIKISALAVLVILGVLASDYMRAENAIRDLRLRSLGLINQENPVGPINPIILDQLFDYINFANQPTTHNVSAEEIQKMEDVYYRYPYPPVMFKYALTLGINSRPLESSKILRRLCATHPAERCLEGRVAWEQLQKVHPELRGVPYPEPISTAK